MRLLAQPRFLAPWLWLLCAAVGAAAVTGTVINRTTARPQANTIVTLYSLGQQGMAPVQTVKSDAQGGFRIDHELEGPHLIQTVHSGVVYNKMIPPGTPAENLELDVYDSVARKDLATISQHMVLIEPMGGILHVNESIIVRNDGNLTYNDAANGTVQVYLPLEIQGTPRLMATAPQGMPVQRDVVKTESEGVYQIDFPVKPGETRFDLTYVLPEADPLIYRSKVLHGGGPVRLVAPQGVTLTGDAITEIGEEPQTHAKIYDVTGTEYAVNITGTGSLRVPGDASSGAGGGGGAGIEQIRARIYDRVHIIIGLALLILMAGFILLYRRPETAPPKPAPPAAPKGKRK